LRKIVEEELGINVFADNCANASALAESWFGAGRGIDNFVLLSFGAGVGAGVIIDGMLYRGEDDVVAEIGHTTVDMKGPQCVCGNYGCLELYSSSSVMEKRAKKRVKDARKGLLYESVGGDPEKITAGVIFEAANKRDPIAQAVVEEEAQYLGVGVVNLVNIFSPEVVIIGTNDLPDLNLNPLISPIREMIKKRAFSVVSQKVQVVPSLLKSSVQLIGAITLVLQDFFNSDRFKYAEETFRLRA
jgi:predicted NBD/HSP70 family sugar kinase